MSRKKLPFSFFLQSQLACMLSAIKTALVMHSALGVIRHNLFNIMTNLNVDIYNILITFAEISFYIKCNNSQKMKNAIFCCITRRHTFSFLFFCSKNRTQMRYWYRLTANINHLDFILAIGQNLQLCP